MSGGRQLQIDNTNKDNICRHDLCILQNETIKTYKINKKLLCIVKKIVEINEKNIGKRGYQKEKC